MNKILVATLVITVIGMVVSAGLVFASKKFHVDVDERVTAIRSALPGNNCGACGFAGCDAMAAAIARGDAPAGGCPVGGAPVAEKIAAIMGRTPKPPSAGLPSSNAAGQEALPAPRGTTSASWIAAAWS